MNNRRIVLTRALFVLVLVAMSAAGLAMLTSDPVEAGPRRPPGPLCGPDILWLCTFKDGSTELVGATRCEIEKFEKKNKATCVPASF